MKIFTVLLLTVCCCLGMSATPSDFHQFGLQHLAQENGLANNTLLDIHQDKKGFLWLGTDVGISRYDGIHFHNYDLTDIEPRAIKRICEMEQDSLLWLKLDQYEEVACFDKRTGIFIPLTFQDERLKSNIQDLCISDSILYAISENNILQLSYSRNESSIEIVSSALIEHNYSFRKIISDKKYLYALDEGNNIIIYNYGNKRTKQLDFQRIGTKKSIENIFALNDHLWISTNWNGTYCYNPQKDFIKKLETSDASLNNLLISDLGIKDDTVFIASTPHAILTLVFSDTNYTNSSIKVTEIPFDNFMYDSFIKNRISRLFVDRDNSVVWLGTFGKGLLKSNIQDDNINRILLGNSIRDINEVEQDARGYIWLTTKNNGIWRSTDNVLSPNMKFAFWENSSADGYYCMHKDETGSIWIGDETGNVTWMNLLSNNTTSFQPKYDDINSIGGIRKIFLCSHNYLWLVTEKGLFVYDHKSNKCQASMPYNEEITQITALCEDGDGIVWLGTNDGVRRVELKNNSINLENELEAKAGVSKGEVLSIYANRYNQLYISYTDKIIQTNSEREGIESIMIMQKDMISGRIQCITDDKNGNTWMGNNIGIMTIHNKTKVSYTYPFPERFYSVCQLNDGQLLWSNSTGLMYFDPRVLKKNLPEQLYISDIGVNYNIVEIGEEISGQVILKKPIYQMNELVLNHANNNIVFYLTDLSYKQMPNKIEYRLLPDYPEWTSSYKSEIEFSDLPSGSYKLEVRPISISEEEVPLTTLDIRIKRHWANTGLAYFGYIVFLTCFGALIWYYIKAKTARKLQYKEKEEKLMNSLAEEKKSREEEETAHRQRNQARYGLARELRTPLSLVAAPLKEMIADTTLPQALLPKAKVAYRNTISMQDVCNLMLNIYEQENDNSSLQVGPYPVYEIVNSAISSSNELLNVAPIKLYYDKNNRIKKEVWIDRKKIEYLFRNILSNAYRHISYAGNVHVKVSIENIDAKGYFCFQVKDDGKSIIEKSATYTLSKENSNSELAGQLQSELGIFMMKEYIVAHHGNIRIECDTESGSCTTVYIPLGKEHFEGDSDVTFIDPEKQEVPAEEAIVPEIITPEEKEQQIIEEDEMPFSTPTPGGKHKILVIEDHKDIRLYLKVLFSANYTVLMAENGEEGVQMARKEMPDIILSDVMMPVMNGFECTRILKEDMKTCHIPIIILTALVGDMDVVKGIELGADDYILKPFNPEILRSKVKRLIKNRMDLKQAYMKLMMASNTNDNNEQDEDGPKEDPFIRQIFDITEKNLQNPDFNVKKLAEMLNMSQPTLYRRVKMLTNYTIIELIRGVRLKRSAELLRTRKYSIQEVSEMVGYNDAPTFRKHFVDFYGTTPSTFANKEEADDKKIQG